MLLNMVKAMFRLHGILNTHNVFISQKKKISLLNLQGEFKVEYYQFTVREIYIKYVAY